MSNPYGGAGVRRDKPLRSTPEQTSNAAGTPPFAYGNIDDLSDALHRIAENLDLGALEVESQPIELDDLHNIALGMVNLGYHDDAIRIAHGGLERASALPDQDESKTAQLNMHLILARALREAGRLGEAERQLNMAETMMSEHNSHRANLDLERANIAAQRGDPETALSYLERTVALVPNTSVPWNNIAFQLWELGRQTEAVSAMERALSISADIGTSCR